MGEIPFLPLSVHGLFGMSQFMCPPGLLCTVHHVCGASQELGPSRCPTTRQARVSPLSAFLGFSMYVKAGQL